MTSSTPRFLTLCLLLPLCVALPAQAQQGGDTPGDIVQTAKAAGNFTTLAAALSAADLVKALKAEGPFTVFAPTDEAFEALPEGTLDNLLKPENKAQLQSILKYHVVSGKAMASDVTGMDAAETLQGQSIQFQVQDGTVTLSGENQATVTTADIAASNGVIHVIDTVLMPPTETASN
jgi:uncharacterized surface protein with fasciclin (FAS1) repeats